MALVGLVGGFLSRLISGRSAFTPRRRAVVAAFATLRAGIAAMVTGSGGVHAAVIAANVALCVPALVVRARPREAGVERREPAGVHR